MNETVSQPPQLLLSFPDYFPDPAIAEVLADFNLPESFIEVRKVEQHAYAAFEWTIPTVFMVYMGKTLFEALIKETVKEYTPNLLAGIKALAKRCQQLRSRFITSTGSDFKINPNYNQSSAFSLVVQTQSGRHIKMLFDEELTPADWEDAIDGIIGTVAMNHMGHPSDKLEESPVLLATAPTSQLYVLYNRERKTWELHNDQTLVHELRIKSQGM